MGEAISGVVQHQTHAAGLGVSDALGDARDKIASTSADAQKRIRTASGEVEASIEHHPVTAVLIGFAVRLSIGMFSRFRG